MCSKKTKEEYMDEYKSFKGIKLLIVFILIFVLLVTIGIFCCLLQFPEVVYSKDTDLASRLLEMQSVTLAVSAISISLVSGIVTILTIYREKKVDMLNHKVEDDLSKVKEERNMLSKLIYLQSSSSRYLLGAQYDELVKLGEEICNRNLENKQFLLYTIASLLETYATQDTNISSAKISIYERILIFAEAIINDTDIKKPEKINALYMCINANYRIFRNEYELNPDTTDDNRLNEAIVCINKYESEYKQYGNFSKSATELNLAGLVYYWKYIFELRKKSNLNDDHLKNITSSKQYFSSALNQNNSNELIHNNYGCCFMGFAKYHYLKQDYKESYNYYQKAQEQFNKSIELSPTYEKPYINLIDICCQKVKMLLDIRENTYLLYPFILKLTKKERKEIVELYDSITNHFEKAKQSGKMLYNVYSKIAEIKTYRLLVAYSKNENNLINGLKDEIEKDISKALEDSRSVTVLMRKRQFYELCNDKVMVSKVNDEISEFDEENANRWIKIFDRD